MRYSELLSSLEKIGVDDPKTEAELILNHLFSVNRANIIFDSQREYEDKKILEILEKREKRID